jgi:hypothetical protein
MLDKIRLHARGALPPEYQANLGEVRPPSSTPGAAASWAWPMRSCARATLQGGCDEEILAWAHARGTPRNDEECLIWNRFMTKIGWRDDRSDLLRERVKEYGLGEVTPETFCELFDADEGRPPAERAPGRPHPISSSS